MTAFLGYNTGSTSTAAGSYTAEPFVAMGSNYYGFLNKPEEFWIRIRAYLPGGTMPTASFGAVV